mmetsp:Transcript_13699/g.25095  ORF Transcript_13699/g.25095 Transcript_13699/m.25095 type:complete len:120 (-) Transcript_13699:435-794(-)
MSLQNSSTMIPLAMPTFTDHHHEVVVQHTTILILHCHHWILPQIIRECVEHRIEKIMAACHVLHRLLFIDAKSSLGTEVVVVTCSILSDLYRNRYCSRRMAVDEMVVSNRMVVVWRMKK